MIARQLIAENILPLRPAETGESALAMMDELRVSQLPVADDGLFLGLISDTDILTYDNPSESVGTHPLSLSNAYILEDQHIYEVIRIMDAMKLTLLPVLDEKKHYLGSVTLVSLSHHFAGLMALNNPGGIIILELNDKDYLLTEIAQIVESNDAKILGMYITTFPDSTRMEVTLKLNKIDVGPILQTFTRYKYNIKASFSEDTYTESLQERYNSLMNYLNI
ncbi:MAG: CBS domain-containing protein [Bacteroidetes bacterium]|nr:CBS domain-containing protein [Bacteroidota bacterium]